MSCETCAAACPAAKGTRTSGGQGAGVAVALLGQPNSGKSTLFNGLTGARQHVGNWPGKTVERKEGSFRIGDTQCRVVDLPGAYGLSANSPEEEVTRDYLESGDADVVVVMADASQLQRSLYMLAEFAAAHPEQPSLLVLNLMDVAEGQGKRIDSALIEQRLGIPVVPLVASRPEGYGNLLCAIERTARERPSIDDGRLRRELASVPATAQGAGKARFAWIEWLLDGAVSAPEKAHALSRFDRLATGSRWSKPITVAMILAGFLLAFVPAIPIMMLGGAISSLGQVAAGALAQVGAPDVVGSFLAGVVFNSLCFGTMMVGYVFGINLVFGLSGSRVIDSWGQRMLTVMMAWAIPCGSTWGVVPVLAVAFFGVVGAPLVIVGIFAMMLVIMGIVGKVFGPRLVADGERSGLVMELPPYHRPHLKGVVRGALLKSRQMFVRAIRVVAIFAFVIWALTYTSTGGVEGSALYALGTAIEPVTRLFGMGWQTFTAWLCALVLKESALGVLSGLFTGAATPNAVLVGIMTGDGAAAANVGEVMSQVISAPEALAFIFAFTFNMPCAASVSATWAEVHSTKWTVITAVFYIASSLLLGCAVYHVSALFF